MLEKTKIGIGMLLCIIGMFLLPVFFIGLIPFGIGCDLIDSGRRGLGEIE